MPTFNRQVQRGFSLIELVLVVVLLGILGATGMSMLYDPFATADIVNATNANASKSRYALERIARELRETKYAAGAFCFTSMGATSVTFRKNDVSGSDCTTGSTVTVSLSGTSLSLNGAVLASGVASFSLDYRDINGATTASSSNVSSVVISVTVADPDSGSAGSVNANSQRSRVFLRNVST